MIYSHVCRHCGEGHRFKDGSVPAICERCYACTWLIAPIDGGLELARIHGLVRATAITFRVLHLRRAMRR